MCPETVSEDSRRTAHTQKYHLKFSMQGTIRRAAKPIGEAGLRTGPAHSGAAYLKNPGSGALQDSPGVSKILCLSKMYSHSCSHMEGTRKNSENAIRYHHVDLHCGCMHRPKQQISQIRASEPEDSKHARTHTSTSFFPSGVSRHSDTTLARPSKEIKHAHIHPFRLSTWGSEAGPRAGRSTGTWPSARGGTARSLGPCLRRRRKWSWAG